MESTSLQDTFAPNLICFGCGPANENGLQIKSFIGEDEKVVMDFSPQSHHQAFEGIVNGGIIGTLLDCHMNWTAAWSLMEKAGSDKPPCCVTGEFQVKFQLPTPSSDTIRIEAWVVDRSDRRANIEANLFSGGKITATGNGVFIAVKEGHPAFHRW